MIKRDYDRVRRERPELMLPPWQGLSLETLNILITLSEARLIARRTAVILSRENVLVPDPSLLPIGPESDL